MIYAAVALSVILGLLIWEVVFRFLYQRRNRRSYHVSYHVPWKDSYVIAHPFLSFAYARNEIMDRNQKLPYPIHTNRYFSFHQPLRLNNLGHFGEDFLEKRPEGQLRVACLGTRPPTMILQMKSETILIREC